MIGMISMISKEILITYVKLWDISKDNKDIHYTKEQLDLIKYVNFEARNNERLNNLLRSLINQDNKVSIIERYYNENKEIKFDYLSSDLQERIIAFYENPELLDLLSKEEQNNWKQYIGVYAKKVEQENKNIDKPKEKKLIKEDGFISSIEFLLLVCVLVTITISIIICVNL